jgi:thiol-disulfide isomerase/thioredoxin
MNKKYISSGLILQGNPEILAIFFPVVTGICQQRSGAIQPLAVGDSIPYDLVLKNVYNYQGSSIRLSDLKGKLVILDFWNTGCAGCITSASVFITSATIFKWVFLPIVASKNKSSTYLFTSSFCQSE